MQTRKKTQWSFVAIIAIGTAVAGAAWSGSPETAPTTRIRSDLGATFELPSDWLEASNDVTSIRRWQAPECAEGDAPVLSCPVFVVLARVERPQLPDAIGFSALRAREQAQVLHARGEGRFDAGGEPLPWRLSDYRLGAIDMRLLTTTLTRGDIAWELTAWAAPQRYAEFDATFRAMGRSLRIEEDH